MGDCFSKVIANQGAAGLYRGMHIYFLVQVASAFGQVSLYEAL